MTSADQHRRRVTVMSPFGQHEVDILMDVPASGLLPDLLAKAGLHPSQVKVGSEGWRLEDSRGNAVPPGKTLAQFGVLAGDVIQLYGLHPAPASEGPSEFAPSEFAPSEFVPSGFVPPDAEPGSGLDDRVLQDEEFPGGESGEAVAGDDDLAEPRVLGDPGAAGLPWASAEWDSSGTAPAGETAVGWAPAGLAGDAADDADVPGGTEDGTRHETRAAVLDASDTAEPALAGPEPAGPEPAGADTQWAEPARAEPPVAIPPGPVVPGPVVPGAMPSSAIPPGAIPPGAMPRGAMPPGSVPPGSMPPRAMPPGAMPPGAMPPGAVPPGGVTPAAGTPRSIPQGPLPPVPGMPPAAGQDPGRLREPGRGLPGPGAPGMPGGSGGGWVAAPSHGAPRAPGPVAQPEEPLTPLQRTEAVLPSKVGQARRVSAAVSAFFQGPASPAAELAAERLRARQPGSP